MPFFLVKRTDPIQYDEHDSFVICAKDEAEASVIAINTANGFEKSKWAAHSEVITLNPESDSGVICASFNAG